MQTNYTDENKLFWYRQLAELIMNIETLRIFCDLVELQNFSRTAEKYGISQSAISQQLAQLELLYKTQLINRKKRPLAATS